MLKDVIQTRNIERIIPQRVGKTQKYKVQTAGFEGQEYVLESVNANPRHLILVNDEPVCTCTEYYVPIPNYVLKDMTNSVLEKIDIEPIGATEDFPKQYQWVYNVILEKDKAIMPDIPDDRYDLGISITNSYDLSMGVHVMSYFYRLVCNNGLYMKFPAEQQHFKHMRAKGNVDELMELIGDTIETVVRNRVQHQQLLIRTQKSGLRPHQTHRVLKQLCIRKYELELLKPFGILGTIEDDNVLNIVIDNDKMKTEYDLINALTNIANDVRTPTRAWDLQRETLNMVVSKRNPSPYEKLISP